MKVGGVAGQEVVTVETQTRPTVEKEWPLFTGRVVATARIASSEETNTGLTAR